MLIFNLADIVSSITLAINCLIKPFTMAGLAVLFLNHDFARLFDRPRGQPTRHDRKLPWLHRHHLDPPLAPPFVNMT
jgi:hypothetical protein